ncbi:MAG: uroporphyrinogen decarboxylase [Betaproteobacteria bacterium]
MLKNDVFIRALLRQPTPYTPVWIMRQAGRYLPEYNRTRARAGSFLGLCRNPDLCTEVTLQPLERFALDAAIVFSDILTIPDAMGLGLHFVEGEGPKFARPLREESQVDQLIVPEPKEHLPYVLQSVAQVRRELAERLPLIGFSGSPFTLACYMIEGGTSADWRTLKAMLYGRPDLLHRVLDLNCRAVITYLNAQIEAGADVVMIFDTWGGMLSTPAFREFSLTYLTRVVTGIKAGPGRSTPTIVFTKGGGVWIEDIAATGCDAIGIDWTLELATARKRVGERAALQGNLDPAVLFAEPVIIRKQAARVLASFGPGHGHVFNLGHGISQFTNPDNVGALVDAVHDLSPAFHRS